MAIKHSALTAPTGVTITGVLIHEKETTEEDIAAEVFDNEGIFSDGKSLRTKTTHRTSGESLSTASLPTVGTGAATSASPKIDSVKETEKSEGAADFSVEDHYYSAGQGDYS